MLADFRQNRFNVWVVTDVASRGLAIKYIGFVIHIDLPPQISDYVHRVVRTGRAAASDVAYTFIPDTITPKRAHELISILEETNQEVPPLLASTAAAFKSGHNRGNDTSLGFRGGGGSRGGPRGGFRGGRGGRGGFRGGAPVSRPSYI